MLSASRSPRTNPRNLLRTALAIAAGTLVAGLASAGPSDAQTGAAAVVIHADGQDLTVTTGELENGYDVRDRDYALRSQDGHEEPLLHITAAASVRRVLDLAGVNPDSVGFVETRRGDGTYATLDRADVSSSPPFADGPPVVFVDGPSIRYLRPVRGQTDSNASDNLATQTGAPLELTVHSGNLLDVDATASDLEIDQGETVSFSATASGAADGESVSFAWDFDDGAVEPGASVTHSFTAEGTYEVIARATGDRDSAGTSALLRVIVGEPPPAEGGLPGGGTGDDDDLPDGHEHGDGPGGNGHGDGAGDGRGDDGRGGGSEGDGGSGDGGDTVPPGATPLPTGAITPAGAPIPDTDPSDGQAAPEDEAGSRDDEGDDYERVAGRLLSAAVPAALVTPASAEPAVARPPEKKVWSGAGLLVGTLALVLAGAALEKRSAHTP